MVQDCCCCEDLVASKVPNESIEHFNAWRESLWIRCGIWPGSGWDIRKMCILKWEELASRDEERLVVDCEYVKPGFQGWLEHLENSLKRRRILTQGRSYTCCEVR
jgi:hypothetical protein